MHTENFKVIIAGAGPSGIATALALLENGTDDILVIDCAEFPRYKCCAGYVTGKTKQTYARFGLNAEECGYSLIKDFNILYNGEKKLTVPNKFLYTNRKIDRVELDYAFFRLAEEKGVTIMQKTRITSHDRENNSLILTGGIKVSYGYLVFADGTSGYGSRYQKNKRANIAMQLIFPSEADESIDIHFGVTPRGYAWVSSCYGVTNVGVTDVYKGKKNYKKIFSDFLARLGLEADIKNLKSAFTPIGVRKGVINKNIYFVGDAVGACDPLTLSGLRYGLQSGRACAAAIAKNKNGVYRRYINGLKIKFGFMRIMQKVFYLKPVRFLVFNGFCRYFGGFVTRVFNDFFVNKK